MTTRILLVEDDPLIVDALTELLTSSGKRDFTVPSGQ